jgi:hypothetical protein
MAPSSASPGIVIAGNFQSHERDYRRRKGAYLYLYFGNRNTLDPLPRKNKCRHFGGNFTRKRASLLADIFPHWSDTMTTTANYFYRENPDSTIDSICPRCFQTIASGQILDELKGVEEEHRCSSLEELHRQYVDSERSIF